MEKQTLQVVSEFVTAVQQMNQEKLAALLHPDVKWHQPGNHRFSGVKQNCMEVFQMVGGMFQVSENTLALTDIKLLAVNGNSAACVLHFKATRPGATLDTDNIDVYTVADGKIIEARIHVQDPEQEDTFWGKTN
ncbi:nuclear transport factor 2 family protein [Chitinophaga agrisoli]|uniref:Nuclear transport factor 2 family protein n=1 Tax=Chitinophaga agrisoli TaxID=2607653 RepID=A0A5B2VXF6_9BACT|nr:nuclear transport factor 2 family protein [Chitinophaga agrisoli]KAA2243765.1 nuclear transport factor 2 family protein [Chitinophaga agrisoli]